jgi:hypothetical protein
MPTVVEIWQEEWFLWLFGGLGASIVVALLGWIIRLFWKNHRQKEQSINISNNGKKNTGIALNDAPLNNSPFGNTYNINVNYYFGFDNKNGDTKNTERVVGEMVYREMDSNIKNEQTTLSDSVELCLQKAEQGDPESQFCLGVCYWDGKGLEKNFVKAVEWWSRAAEQDHNAAQYNLGCSYIYGAGIQQNSQKAFEWFNRSAQSGFAHAQHSLGMCYKHGEGVEADPCMALEWFTQSAQQGNAMAQAALGCCYYFGEGVEKNDAEAVEWFHKSAAQGYTGGQSLLGFCYYQGNGVVKNDNKAFEWTKKPLNWEILLHYIMLGHRIKKA